MQGNALKALRKQKKNIFVEDNQSVPKDIVDLIDMFRVEDKEAINELNNELFKMEENNSKQNFDKIKIYKD